MVTLSTQGAGPAEDALRGSIVEKGRVLSHSPRASESTAFALWATYERGALHAHTLRLC